MDDDKYLVHVCLEGPEAGVYYRSTGEITNNFFTTIVLPDYVTAIADEFTVHITAIYNGTTLISYSTGEVENNQFNVYGENGEFFWIVHGKRLSINTEPFKKDIEVKGNGPYKWSTTSTFGKG